MITEWVPKPTSPAALDVAVLSRFADTADTLRADAGAAAALFDEALLSQAQGWLKLPESDWQEAIRSLEENKLFSLALFFTLAENQFSGWQCGAKNPAIWIIRYLKANGLLPEKAVIRELKSLTDNRFIPYGSAL